MQEIMLFTLIALLLVLSPGPNSILILKTVGRDGQQAGVQNIMGLVVATFVHGAISILGLSALIVQSAALFTLVKVLGAAYLFYLGMKTIWQTFHSGDLVTREDSPASITNKKAGTFFVEGFLTQLLNPKVSMFYLAAFPQFIDFQAASILPAFVLVAIHATMIFFWFLFVTFAIVRIKRAASHPGIGRWIQRISGSLLVYFSALLATQEVNR